MLQLTDVIIDCPDTMALARFYSELTGRPVKDGSHEDWAGIRFGDIELAFIRVDDYRAPRWPDAEHPKQFHLDFEVDDIEAEQARALALGATLQQDFLGPDGYGWRVYTDPVGHPFCFCRNRTATWTPHGLTWTSAPESGDRPAAGDQLGDFDVDDLLLLSAPEARTPEMQWNQAVTAYADYVWLDVAGRVRVFRGALPDDLADSLLLRWHGLVPTPSGSLVLSIVDTEDRRHPLLGVEAGSTVRVSVFSDLFRGATELAIVVDAADDDPPLAPAFPAGVLPVPDSSPVRSTVGVREGLIERTRRPYAWGALHVADSRAGQSDFPIAGDVAFARTGSGIAIRVPVPDDLIYEYGTPNNVNVRVRRGPAPIEVSYTAVIATESRSVVVGDADGFIEIDVPGATTRVDVLPYPEEHPIEVDVWLSEPADADLQH